MVVGPLLAGPLIRRPLTPGRLLGHSRAAVGGAPAHRRTVPASTTPAHRRTVPASTTPTHRRASAALGLGDARPEQHTDEERAGGDDRRKLLADHHFITSRSARSVLLRRRYRQVPPGVRLLPELPCRQLGAPGWRV